MVSGATGRITRRALTLGLAGFVRPLWQRDFSDRKRTIVFAPSSLGLRPGASGKEPGVWRTPEVLMRAHLDSQLNADQVVRLPHPTYERQAQRGTSIRNGLTIRKFSLELAAAVREVLAAERFPIVIGGDCSVLLGCLYGARIFGGKGLVHIDGHRDFFHPTNFGSTLGSAAGMDLALATGRGEDLLTKWPNLSTSLAADEDTIQIGDRDALTVPPETSYDDIVRTKITRLSIQDVLRVGMKGAASLVIDRLRARELDKAFLHLDLDVLDASTLPAVDSPGTPGLDFRQLEQLLGALLGSGRICGMCVCIYDPDLDPEAKYPGRIVDALREAFLIAKPSITRKNLR